jgi:hypothetical protein
MNVTGNTGWTPAYNKMLYVVDSANTSQTNFRYVCDVETTAGVRLARLKSDKLPSTYGFFDVSKVVETLIAPQAPSLSETAVVNHDGFTSGYRLQFYDEYGTSPVVITGSPTVVSGVGVFAGNLEQLDLASYDSDTYFPPSSSVLPSSRGLTSRDNGSASTALSDSYGWSCFGQGVSGNTVIDNIEVRYSTGRTFLLAVPSGSTNAIRVASGPAQLKALTSGQTSDGLPGLTNFPGAGGSVAIISYNYADGEYGFTFQYNIAECAQFNTIPVHYINQYGGIDTYLFTMKNRRKASVSRQIYGANSDVYGTLTYDKQWAGEFTYTYNLNSDWLTDLESELLMEMIRSAQVWLQIDGAMVEAIVNTNSYQFYTRRNDRLQQLQVEISVAYRNSIL